MLLAWKAEGQQINEIHDDRTIITSNCTYDLVTNHGNQHAHIELLMVVASFLSPFDCVTLKPSSNGQQETKRVARRKH